MFIITEMAALPPRFTVANALIASGISNEDGVTGVGSRSNVDRISDDVFGGRFSTARDLSYKDLEADFKTYADLTVAEGRIRLTVRQKKNLRAFLQWTKDEYRYGRDPSLTAFPIVQVEDLIRRNKMYEVFTEKSKDLSSAAEPDKFKSNTKWNDWKPTFLNYPRLIPGRNCIPLSYVCRKKDGPDPTPQTDFLEEYVNMAPLIGDAYEMDNFEVRMYLMKFITDIEMAEATVQAIPNTRDGRSAFKALTKLYEGFGLHGIYISRVDRIIHNLFYHSGKKPHMWWTEFEKNTCLGIWCVR